MAEEPSYKRLEKRGEDIYDEMYDSGSSSGFLSEIKECFYGAIQAAEQDGLKDEVIRLRARLDHIVEGHRRHFTNEPGWSFDPPLTIRARPFDVLLGMPLSIVRRATSMLVLHFGAIRPHQSGEGTVGDYAFHIQCAWRFSRPLGIATGSRDLWNYAGPGEQPKGWSFNEGMSLQDRKFDELIGGYDAATRSWYNREMRLVVQSTERGHFGNVRIDMAQEDCQLFVFPDSCPEGGEAYRFFSSGGGKHLVFP